MRWMTSIHYQYPSIPIESCRSFVHTSTTLFLLVIDSTIPFQLLIPLALHLFICTWLFTHTLYIPLDTPLRSLPIETIEKPYWADVAVHQTIPYASSLRNMHIIAYTSRVRLADH
jgi:hypothetical protein